MEDNIQKAPWLSIVQVVLIALMFIGLLFSRALLSISMIVSIVLPFLSASARSFLFQNYSKSPMLIGMAIYYLLHLLSFFWAADLDLWSSDLQLKLPVLLFPLAVFSFPLQDHQFRKSVLMVVQGVLLVGVFYSFYFLWQHWDYFLTGKHFKGPMENDYLRFAIALVLTVNLTLYEWFQDTESSPWAKFKRGFNIGFVAIVMLYLHLQSSKLGLLAIYSLLLIIGIGFFKKKWGTKLFLVAMGGGLFIMVVAAWTSPVFNHQFSRIEKEIEVWKAQDHQGFNDPDVTSFVPRLISYKIACELMEAHPLTGVGAGQVFPAMKKVYKQDYPEVKLIIAPHNQVLNSGVALGGGAAILVLLLLLYPCWKSGNIFGMANGMVLFIACMVEAMWEIQNGLFIYLFFTFWWINHQEVSNKKSVVFNKNKP